jgi:serine/threonine-protein kinase
MHEVPRGDALRRFGREAKSAAGLQHPDMIEVFDLGEHEGRPFLVMELVASPTLAGAIQAAGAPPSVAAVVELGELPPDPGEVPVVAVEVEEPILGAALREAGITLVADGPLALVAFEALGRPAGTRLARLALHPAPTAAVISAAIRLGAAGVARWPGPIEPLVQQIRKCWRCLPRP